MSASVIDVFDFCRLAEQREGALAGAELPRLAEEAVDGNPVLSWSLRGDVNQYGHARVAMKVSGSVTLVCQRCMKPFEHQIDSAQVLVFAQSDTEADEIEALLDDESIDVVVAQKSTKVADLIEDEALLSLPSSPRHEVCPDRDAASILEEVRKPSPFDVLKGLKQ
ncbi:YceD family protein [uncultured Oxalicibacterium sp.]|uniref:YceD family protein n=1 Tax=uncultured Oxalicibacterium sp. TaxID=1168540 RepID=UPI0025DC245A|nr:YceD family protein [uncultured Oxalicibacterium sp.]